MNQPATKQLLIDAAVELFVTRGFHAVSTRALADKAGVNLGAIQYHFGSKEKLFIAAVHSVWSDQASPKLLAVFEVPSDTKAKAAQVFGTFVAAFLDDLLRPSGPQPCRMMFREIFAAGEDEFEMCEELITSVVEEFIRPIDSKLVDLLAVLFPERTNRECLYLANSVIGQCFFYMTHEAFLKRLRGLEYVTGEACRAIARHIVSFSLIGISEAAECIPLAEQAASKFFDSIEDRNE